ncbi:hypothetical protein BDQ12DRAFT_692598 [Crucibulum laeve]|uniref:NADH:flavin oxidoreductase/NADH oxidase N-terminal domain-containing protein n=1 Tax=Crucibulum laeve TaxID=68775 RepID=A0A5C3LTA7_9AGAR|nr:hypothetical protein BDQ12DRAFT_659737 [Crucibulum laeve]TFK32316.1 hypothetical protein BDQ12DRAFT_692598 [Crucibulum laeve]
MQLLPNMSNKIPESTGNTPKTTHRLFSPVTLPCGRRVRNRLVKVAMYEHLATLFGGPPNEYQFALYSEWSKHDWGMIFTGNVQVSKTHLTLGRDMVIPDSFTEKTLEPFKTLASRIHGSWGKDSSLAIMQLNHSGRQSSNFIGGRPLFQPPLAPSAIRVKEKNGGLISDAVHHIMFQTPQPMSLVDIDDLVLSFVKGTKLAFESGFDGVQLHAAHGYLLAQFISPKSNTRIDDYSVAPKNVLRLLHRVVTSIREAVPAQFVVGLKLNAADYLTPLPSAGSSVTDTQTTGSQEDRALKHVLAIAQWGSIDFIEISGGDYEKPSFMASENYSSKSPRQAFFARFSHRAMQALDSLPRDASSPALPLILLTGGLRTPGLLHSALASRHADLLGIGRGSVLCPDLPTVLKEREDHEDRDQWEDVSFAPEPDLGSSAFLQYWPLTWFWAGVPNIGLIGAGVGMAWYVVMIRKLALDGLGRTRESYKADYNIGGLGAVLSMWAWICSPNMHWIGPWTFFTSIVAPIAILFWLLFTLH